MEYEKKITIGDVADATLSVTIKKETIKDEYQKLLSKYVKEVALPGFRRGKVPAKLFEAKYADVLKKDLTSELIENATKEIFEESSKEERPISCSPIIPKEMPDIDFNEDFTFVLSYDVAPILKIVKDGGFTIKVPVVTVTEKHIQDELKKIQERNAVYKAKEDGEVAEDGNVVTIDFKVFDGEKEEDARRDYVYTLGSGQNSYGFDSDVIGMKKGDVKEIEKTYPDDYELEAFRGKVKKISFTLKDIKVKILPEINDELAQDVSSDFNTLDDLKNNVREKLNRDVELAIRKEKESRVLEQLREANPVVVPKSLIMQTIREELSGFFQRVGISTDNIDQYIEENKEAILKDMEGEAIKRIHDTLLLEELKNTRTEVSIEDEEFDKYLEKLSIDMNMSLANLKDMCNAPDTKDTIIRMLRNDRLFDDIFKTCNFENGDEISSEKYLETTGN
ncbi:MAG: trigger factor [Treponema sp.]